MNKQISRRRLLQGLGVAAGASFVQLPLAISAQVKQANDKLNIAVIGVAGRGGANLAGVSSQNIVALCDVDAARLGAAAAKFPQAKTFADFRKMLPAVEKQIDAVVVSTPDHTHAAPAAMAMHLGKHCYCEKPLTHEVYETRILRQLAQEKKLVTQLGTQIHAGDNYRRVVELIQGGAIGPVREVHVWAAASYGKGNVRPEEKPAVPEGLDWDLWIGPAPMRPYHSCYLPAKWRGWWDFGSGATGDFGCHYMDLPFWALKLRYPTRVEAEGPPQDPEATAPWTIARYEFPARGDLPPVRLSWYDGGQRPEELLRADGLAGQRRSKTDKTEEWRSGVLFIGQRGRLVADYGRHRLLPEKQYAEFARPEPTIPKSIGHHLEWIEACKSGGSTTCNFDYSGALTEAVLLGVVAYRTGAKLQWDAEQLKATNCPAADKFLRREYRPGWTL